MAENKTKETNDSVDTFLATIASEQKRADCAEIVSLMAAATKAPARLWGTAIIGFGHRHLKYDSGRELDWFIIGFSPRKANIALYISGALDQFPDLVSKLGKTKSGKGCLYINTMADIDKTVFKALIKASVAYATNREKI